jgi:hypothetical protein
MRKVRGPCIGRSKRLINEPFVYSQSNCSLILEEKKTKYCLFFNLPQIPKLWTRPLVDLQNQSHKYKTQSHKTYGHFLI